MWCSRVKIWFITHVADISGAGMENDKHGVLQVPYFIFICLQQPLRAFTHSAVYLLTPFSLRHIHCWSNDSSIDIGIPIWPAKLLAPVAFSVLCLRLSLQLYAYGGAIRRNDPSPVGVPLIESAADVAAREAQTVSGADD